MYHSYGLQVSCFRVLTIRTTLILMPKWDLGLALKLIPMSVAIVPPAIVNCPLTYNSYISLLLTRHRITHLYVVPSMVHQLVNSRQTKQVDLSSLVLINSGAAHLPLYLASKLLRMGPTNMEMLQGNDTSLVLLIAIPIEIN